LALFLLTMKEIIKTILSDFHRKELPNLVKRNIEIPLNSGKIVTLIGPRRSGKTFLMYQTMSNISDKTNIIYFNFEDERLDLSAKTLNLILEAYLELYPDKNEEEIFFFFDEIQEVEGWEKFVRRMYDTISKNIFVTGSSAKFLSKEIATSLRGRSITYEVLPLSFKEYLTFQKVPLDINSTKGKAKIKNLLLTYLSLGGFPEVVNMSSQLYEQTLRDYFEVMIYRDIVERYEVTNVLALKLLIKKLVTNSSKEFSINKIFNELKSQGVKVSKDSLYKFVEYSEDAYVMFTISNFSELINKQILKKVYSIDMGISSLLSFSLSKDSGRLFENIVFLELKRRGKNIHFFKNKYECDFVIKKKDKIDTLIQVCYNLTKDNEEREINGLKEAMQRFKTKNGIILTLDQEKEINGIKVVPFWKWALK
jgi:uncharacterized protein